MLTYNVLATQQPTYLCHLLHPYQKIKYTNGPKYRESKLLVGLGPLQIDVTDIKQWMVRSI